MNRGAFLDRDGTINVDPGYISTPRELEFLPGAIEAIGMLNHCGLLVAVITNQSGVARGYHTEADVLAFHAEMSHQLSANGAHVDRFYYCPHHLDGTVSAYRLSCECRKPGAALFQQAISDLDLDPSRSAAIGDKPSDLVPAIELGATGYLISDTKSDEPSRRSRPAFREVGSLLEAVQLLLQ